MKKVVLALTVALTLSAGVLPVAGVSAESNESKPVEETVAPIESEEVQTVGILEEYDDNGNVINTEVVTTDGLNPAEVESIVNGAGSPLNTSPGGISTRAVVVDSPNYDWKKIDTFKGDTKIFVKAAQWVVAFGAANIPAKIGKAVWSGAAGLATYDTFITVPATRYYTSHIYQSQDYYYYYGKSVSHEYSNSARTKKTRSFTYVYRADK